MEKKSRRVRQQQKQKVYMEKSPAICVVVYDPGGNPLSQEVETEILDSIFEIVSQNRLLISFTRT